MSDSSQDRIEGKFDEVKGRGKGRKVGESGPADYAALDPAQLATKLKQLEARMHQHARDLEFEDAARIRDEIHRLRTQGLMS